MKIMTLLILSIVTTLLTSCGEGPNEEMLFEDTKKYINKTSKEIIDLVKVDVISKNSKTVRNDEILVYKFNGTIVLKKDCYLNWNDNKPVFVPELEKPYAFDELNYKFHKVGDTVDYSGSTTYIKKNDNWEVFSM